MKTTKIILAISLITTAASMAFAGPGPQYWIEKRNERARAATPTVRTEAAKPADTCCRVVTVLRPIASHKVTRAVQRVECSGCAAMAAGQKCPSS